jgi:hypothetical protein
VGGGRGTEGWGMSVYDAWATGREEAAREETFWEVDARLAAKEGYAPAQRGVHGVSAERIAAMDEQARAWLAGRKAGDDGA